MRVKYACGIIFINLTFELWMLWNIYYIFNIYITKVLIWLIKLQLIWRLSWLLRFTSYMYQHFGSTYYLFFYFLSMNIGPAYNIHMLFWCQTVISFEIPEYLYALLLCLRSIIYEKKKHFRTEKLKIFIQFQQNKIYNHWSFFFTIENLHIKIQHNEVRLLYKNIIYYIWYHNFQNVIGLCDDKKIL